MALPNGYLLCTNIVIALVRDKDLGKFLAMEYRLTAGKDTFYVSVVVLGEMRAFAQKRKWSLAKQQSLAEILAKFTILDINYDDVIQAYADIDAYSHTINNNMGKNDLWIAATARIYQLTLLTTDHDFDHLYPNWIDREWIDPKAKLP